VVLVSVVEVEKLAESTDVVEALVLTVAELVNVLIVPVEELVLLACELFNTMTVTVSSSM
jgi:hypothetical protein